MQSANLKAGKNRGFRNWIINALTHKEADVREVAARALLWEQPVAAEATLLKLAGDGANEDVVIEALDVALLLRQQGNIAYAERFAPQTDQSHCEKTTNACMHMWRRNLGCELQKLVGSVEEAKNRFLTWVAPCNI